MLAFFRMKKLSLLPLLLMGALCSFAAPQESPESLYKSAVRHEKRGKLEEARLNLLWLASYYSDSPLATRARDEMGAIHLFEDGQARVRDGRYGSATVTFRAVAQVYPESPLAKQAEAASRSAERKEEHTGGPTIRSIGFRNLSPLTPAQILDRFAEREVGLATGQTYRSEDLDEARKIIAELLAEISISTADIRAEVHPSSNNRVKIEFIASSR
jgi:hypothetical protein